MFLPILMMRISKKTNFSVQAYQEKSNIFQTSGIKTDLPKRSHVQIKVGLIKNIHILMRPKSVMSVTGFVSYDWAFY